MVTSMRYYLLVIRFIVYFDTKNSERIIMKNQGRILLRQALNLSQVISLPKVTMAPQARLTAGMKMESPRVATVNK